MSDDIDLEELRASIRDVLDVEASGERVHRHYDSGAAFDPALAQTVAALGWTALALPERDGGLELGFGAAALLYEELGRGPAPIPMLPTLLSAEAIAKGGDDAQRAAWLPPFAGGEQFAAVVLDPPTGLTAQDDRLSGNCGLVADGAGASLFLVALDDQRAALIAAGAPGVAIERQPAIDRTRSLALLSLDGAQYESLPIDLDSLRAHASLAVACDSIGGAAAILERTIEYLKVRVQFGRPIGSFQALKHRIANHQLALEVARAMVTRVVALHAGGHGAAGIAALARVNATETYAAIADDAIQLHGGIGFTWEHDCHHYLKRARMNEMLHGNAETLLDRAAIALTGVAA